MTTTPAAHGNAPYVGLRPFTEDDRHLFFGRERDAEVLFNLVYSTPLTLVYAPSGVGKSSLLQAGLRPMLDKAGNFEVAHVHSWRPPVAEQLTEVIAETFPARRAGRSWCEGLRAHAADTGQCPVLILDQFEEALHYPSGLEAVWEELSVIGTHPRSGARVVLGIREDHLAELDELLRRVPMLIENGLRLGRLNEKSLYRAFHEPLRVLDPPFEADPELFPQMMGDLAENRPDGARGFAEPGYFQVVCQHLWELDRDRPDRTLTLGTYEREGRAPKVVRSYVRGKLDDSLPSEHLEVLYAITRYLVTPTGAKIPLGVDDLTEMATVHDFTPQARRRFGLGDDESETEWPFKKPALQRLLSDVLEELCGSSVLILRRVSHGATPRYELFHDLLGPILRKWRARRRSQAERELAQLAAPVEGLRGTAMESLEHASRLEEADEEARRQVVRELREVLFQSTALKDEALSSDARKRLEALRRHEDDWKLRLEAGRALGQSSVIESPSWVRALPALVVYTFFSMATVFLLAYGTREAITAVGPPSLAVPWPSLILGLGWIALVWPLLYFAQGVSHGLYSRRGRWRAVLRPPFEPHSLAIGWFEHSSGWPFNFAVSVVPAVMVAPLLAQLALPLLFWLAALACLGTAFSLVAYNRAVVLV
ncbi:ATP-binding protein [Streptomyces tritici]|uniref:ATP-binding protein n=1 Tax=Streptomyces tritici TaxID=2054410 RepID=UPI003AEFC2BB